MVILTKRLIRSAQVRKHNSGLMGKMLDYSMTKMQFQRKGCNDSMGAAYINNTENTRDSIAILASGLGHKYLRQFYGLISEEHQRPLVRHIIYNWSVDVSFEHEYARFVDFLQALQDAHDDSFDHYNEGYTDGHRMTKFLEKCIQIRTEFKL